jgi:hypothetical protein
MLEAPAGRGGYFCAGPVMPVRASFARTARRLLKNKKAVEPAGNKQAK